MQGSLFDFEPESIAEDKLFFALVPDAEVALEISKRAEIIRADFSIRTKVRTDHFHLTLNPLEAQAGLRPEFVDRVLRAAATVRFSAFDIRFDQAMSFISRNKNSPLVLTCSKPPAALSTLYNRLKSALLLQRLPLTIQSFKPHLTLLYDPAHIDTIGIEIISWPIAEFVLIHGRTGERYQILGRWPASN